MKTAATFQVEARETYGKGASRELRRNGKIPAVLYGKGQEPLSFVLNEKDFVLFFQKGGITNKLIDLQLGGKTYHVLPREVQLHPVTDKVEHVDFLKVDENSRVRVQVPVILLNTDRCIGVKRGGAINIVRHEVELVCKPDSIPASLKIDMLNVNIGGSVHISHVELPADVIPAITDRDFTIITVAGRGGKEEEEATAAATTEATAAAPAKK